MTEIWINNESKKEHIVLNKNVKHLTEDKLVSVWLFSTKDDRGTVYTMNENEFIKDFTKKEVL